jgi:putative ABC transport system permease protein
MGGLTAYAWRSVVARPARSILTAIGIALGVALLAGTAVTVAGIDRAVERTVAEVAGDADVSFAAFAETGLSDAAVATIAATDGVAVAAPTIERRTYLAPTIDDPTLGDVPVAVLGIDPTLDPQVRDLVIIEGAALARADEPSALIAETFAASTGTVVGDEIELYGAVDAPPGTGRVRVVGIVEGDGPLVGAGGRLVILPIDRARTLFDLDGVSRVDVVLADGAAVGAVTDAVAGSVAEPYVVSTPADLAASLRASTADFTATIVLLAAAALFAGAFLVFNTLSMTVTERIREVALLRAAGTTRGQVTRMVLFGAVLLAIAGTALGLLLGLGLAAVLAWFVRNAFGLRAAPEMAPGQLALVAAIGLLVTVLAAVEPARRAGGVPPVVALMSRADPGIEGRARLRWLVVVAAVVAAVGVALWPGSGDEAGILGPLLVYGLFLLVALLVPFVIGPLARLAGLPFALFARAEERLARGAVLRDPGRTALTVGALAIGLGLVVAVGTVAAEARRSASAWLVDVIPGDEVLTTVTPVSTGDDGPIPELEAVAGVVRATPIANFPLAYAGQRLDASAIVGADFAADGRLTFVEGDRDTALGALDAGGAIVLPAAQADRLGLAVGSAMTVAGASGEPVELTVAGVVGRGLPGRAGETVLVGWPDAGDAFGVAGADAIAVRFVDGQEAAASAGTADAAALLGLQPVPLERIQGSVSAALDRVFGLFDALALVAVAVAALGIVNTLSMDVVERVRELGILRAAGMTRRQVARSVVVEAGVLGLAGAILGCLAGLAAAAVLLVLAGQVPVFPASVPWATLGLAIALGVALAMVAAWWPARRAASLSIVRAVRAE